MKFESILATIGNTPVVRINRLFRPDVEVWLKLERANPGASIKDRIAAAMVEDAEKSGRLKPGMTIVEPTSGNTGIGLAMVAAVKGYKLVLVMPESMSIERRKIMAAYGATLDLTPKEQGMKGSIARAEELLKTHAPSWMPAQFDNPANPDIHRRTTGQELLTDFPNGFDYLITGVGTGGHITGCAEILKAKFKNLKVLAVEPEKSALLSGGTHTPHKIQGISPGFIASVVNREVLDGTVTVTEEQAFEYAKRCPREEGIFVGISSGATLAAIAKATVDMPAGSRVVGFCYDTGERYLSIDGLF